MKAPTRDSDPVDPQKIWKMEWQDFLKSTHSPVEVLSGLWLRLGSRDTPFGHLAHVLSAEGVPPEEKSSKDTRGGDLFPIDPKAVQKYLCARDVDLINAVQLMVVALNALSHGPESEPVSPPEELTKAQKGTVNHLCSALEYLNETKIVCPKLEDSEAALQAARFDYQGDPVMMMEDIVAERVIGAWPEVGKCAVQDATRFLPADLEKKLLNPESCLKLTHEWPESPHHSKVRASDEEWNKVVKAAFERKMMVPIHPDEVFKDHRGNPVLNGAGAVKKEKKVGDQVVQLQRFISNLIPSNMFQDRIDGDDKMLPYLGQLTLLEQEEDEVWLVDSEDFTSCFNLFRMPACWRKYMAFGKLVDASLMGGEPGTKVYPAMNVLPMGWVSSVAIIQAIVRTLVFDISEVPRSSEISKVLKIPDDDDLTVIYLDSFDQLRRFKKGCHEVLNAQMSDRHARFLAVCQKLNLPLNEGKRLIAATQGSLQGGELDGERGRYGLASSKMADVIALGAALLGQEKWSEAPLRHFIGKVTFGCCFRRPIFAVLEAVFQEIQDRAHHSDKAAPRDDAWDEVALLVTLVPLMFTNLKAYIDHEISVTDASPTGGGAAVATEFRDPPCTKRCDKSRCYMCERAVSEQDRFPCPALCGVICCSLACVMAHREAEDSCPRRTWEIPKFGERFAGSRAPLSHAVAMKGKIEVQPPFDWHFGDDVFTEQGRETLEQLNSDPCLAFEHWAPECKLFSRARERPIRLRDGRLVDGPKPVRDGSHVMGFPWLPADLKAKVRQSNSMVLRSLKRGKQGVRGPKHYWTVEHPLRSWMWEFQPVKDLEREPGYHYAVGSHCCFGGARQKWFALFGDLPTLRRHLHFPECPGHEGLEGYQVEEDDQGNLWFPTSEEAEYPWAMCQAYADAVYEQLETDGHFEDAAIAAQEPYYLEELAQATSRLAAPEVAAPMANILARAELEMEPGREREHLQSLLRSASYRGTDVRLVTEIDRGDGPELHEQPYLAMRWEWKTIMSYQWKQSAHINELEMLAVAVFLKHRSRSISRQHTRFFHILDSMVSRGCLAKGRSSSRRLNRVAKRCSAYFLGMDCYMFPLWSISRWNFADAASRRHGEA